MPSFCQYRGAEHRIKLLKKLMFFYCSARVFRKPYSFFFFLSSYMRKVEYFHRLIQGGNKGTSEILKDLCLRYFFCFFFFWGVSKKNRFFYMRYKLHILFGYLLLFFSYSA